MSNWREEEHPRDEDGKFTYKNGGEQKKEDKMQKRADIFLDTKMTKNQTGILP